MLVFVVVPYDFVVVGIIVKLSCSRLCSNSFYICFFVAIFIKFLHFFFVWCEVILKLILLLSFVYLLLNETKKLKLANFAKIA